MTQKPQRSYLVGFTAATVVLVIVSAVSVTYYYSSSADLLTKDQEILHLRAQMLVQNFTALELQLKIFELNGNITLLNQQITGLTQSQSASGSEIASLVGQVARLENQSAFLSLELSVVEGAAGSVTIHPYFVNNTVTVAPGTTVQITSQSPGQAGTLAFVSPTGCTSPGDSIQSSSPTFVYYILLDSTSKATVRSDYENVNATSFSFSFQNVGLSPVSCTFSLFYVDH
ncbi:MAG: hypothetical protein JRN06_03430 [Nitrososphaerota archaeon]|nr:hypothetical protein [Nitrososphaerota archaeon]MDG7023090.1 hypothetical protein [Nitrososphaerota archaeon]